jgi:hypothetical protein
VFKKIQEDRMKTPLDFRVLLLSAGLLCLTCSDSTENAAVPEATTAGSASPDMRSEREHKLSVPVEKTEAVWQYLYQDFVLDTEKLRSFEVSLQASTGEELLTNTWFDTPELELYAMQSGVWHRRRTKISDSGANEQAKEKMVVKSSRLVSIVLPDGDVKFGVAYHQKLKSLEDKHPVLGLVKRGKRDKFKKTLQSLNVDASDLQPVLTGEIRRRIIEISYHNSPFLSIALDEVNSEKLWAKTKFAELVVALDASTYAGADADTRSEMEAISAKIIAAIRAHFPDLRPDPASQYNKCFDALAGEISLFRFLVRHGLI